MQEKNFLALCESIRAKCQRLNWYGPDMESPALLRSYLDGDSNGTYFWYDRNGKQHAIRRDTDLTLLPLPATFDYAPATEEQLLVTEEILGFPLPPLLRAVYSQIANGGFGPGYGILGAVGGYDSFINYHLSEKRHYRQVDFADMERRSTSAEVILIPDYVWPDRFLCFCHWGCAIYSYIDCETGRIFRGESWWQNAYGFKYEAPSLEHWLGLWTIDQLHF